MFNSRRWSILSLGVCLLYIGCNGSSGNLPVALPSDSPSPPGVLGRGTVAVVDRTSTATRILVLPPHGDKFQEIPIAGQNVAANSLAFDRLGHLYVGIDNPTGNDKYEVLEIDIHRRKLLREITDLPSWSHSSVATDDENVLYVNTKALAGGDIKLYRPGDTKPWREIKDPHSPFSMLVARGSLWVGYQGFFADALARYRLRSTDRTWFAHVANYLPLALAANPEGSLVAARSRRGSTISVQVADVNSKKRKQIFEGSAQAIASDDSGNLYIAEHRGKIHPCSFHDCSQYFDTDATNLALAVSPLDGLLYVACLGKASIQVYNPRTRNQVKYIPIPGGTPTQLAIEP
ncbi:MAG TPA: hypothetical protein VFE16_13910 [Candidatus Cybelea sp.]|nr:hypothetical protein [Candidatus Cybelea sp.]